MLYQSMMVDIEKQKRIKYVDKAYTNFYRLNVSEDDIECESFTVISIDSLLVYKSKYYLLVYLDNCGYKIAEKQMIDCFGENPIENDKNYILMNEIYKFSITIESI